MTITGDVFLFFLGILALVLMSMSHRNILYALSSSLVWLSLFFWMFFSDSPPLDIDYAWVQILTYAFLILAFMPWIIRMDTEIRNEARGKGGTSQAYRTWGTRPEAEEETPAQKYRKALRRRLR